jgi:pantothenate synthetase
MSAAINILREVDKLSVSMRSGEVTERDRPTAEKLSVAL